MDRFIPSTMRDILKSAGSIRELAQQIGVPSENLAKTVERFNSHAIAGKDEDFNRGESLYDQYYGDADVGKPNSSLAPLTRVYLF